MGIVATNENIHDKEVVMLKQKLKRTQILCKTIWNYRDYIEQIKVCLNNGDNLGASELWDELDYNIQKLLITAPLFGGPFTTKERGVIRDMWKITVDDIEQVR